MGAEAEDEGRLLKFVTHIKQQKVAPTPTPSPSPSPNPDQVMDDPSEELSDEVSVLVPADKLPSDRLGLGLGLGLGLRLG